MESGKIRRRPRVTRHQPVVTGFRVRTPTYPDGHWLNRFWPSLARGVLSVIARIPIYRYILRAHPEAEDLLDTGGPIIFACSHQDIFDCYNGLPRLMQDRAFASMVSYSRDGGLAATGLQTLGYEVVRGSSSRGGGEGLLMLRGHLASGSSVVMAVDGPQAPLGDVKAGVVRLAGASDVPIVPIRAWGKNQWRLVRSWAKVAVTMPFSPAVVCLGRPVVVPRDTTDSRPYQIDIAQQIADLSEWASAWAGQAPVAPFQVAKH
jgi:lysophospholipid acyltransferase (LPLAT)-like uncharacterized protein